MASDLPDLLLHTTYSSIGFYWSLSSYLTLTGINMKPYIVITHTCGATEDCPTRRYTHFFGPQDVTVGDWKYVKHNVNLLPAAVSECV